MLKYSRSLTSRAYLTSVSRSLRQSSSAIRQTSPPLRLWALTALGSTIAASFGYALGTNRVKSTTDQATLVNTYGSSEDFSQAIVALRAEIPLSDETVSTHPGTLQAHGVSMNDYHPGNPHTVVVFPHTTDDVVKIVNISRKFKMPIVPYSGGTSLEGNFSAPVGGSICVDFCNMNKILQINEADGDLVCQPGIGWVEINETLKERGIPLFFPLDPSPSAAIGGMISTGCSGTNAVRYGTAKGEWFLNVTVVLPSGEVIKTRRRSRKSSAGFDLTKLFIGAEGTLGLVVEATLRLTPLLETTVAVCQFSSVKEASEAVREVLSSGVPLQCVELVDEEYMRAANLHGSSTKKWAEAPGIFFKFQGSPETMSESARTVRKIVMNHKASGWEFAKSKEEAEDLWMDRKNALYIGLATLPGSRGWSTDVCVPVSNLPQLVQETKDDLVNSKIPYTMVGHVGDGNFHTLLLFTNEDELAEVRAAAGRMVARALKLDGTCTGEHGVGRGKKQYLNEELGEGTVQLMKSIKKLIDPLNLFNPGKLYPDSPT